MYFIILICLILVTEIAFRLQYYKKHGLKFIPKRIGEYPYNKFIEECDPPLYWRLKPHYAGTQVHINSLGLRSPERREGCRHIWLVGESEFFGAKLICEDKIWFKILQNRLDREGYRVRIMNASVIGYNGHQTAGFVTSLPIEKDDILLLRPNMNDISIAYMQGSDWEEGTPWPMAFVHKLERHKPWYFKLAGYSCIGMNLRRRFFKEKNIGEAFTPKPGFQWERLLAHQEDCLGRMVEFARSRGAGVAFFDMAFSYGPELNPSDGKKLSAIQDNWETMVKGWGQYNFKSMEETVNKIAEPKGLPVLKIASYIWEHPQRYQLFLDLVHLNEQGHGVLAHALYEELVTSGLLTKGK